jgi:hypothetical protein
MLLSTIIKLICGDFAMKKRIQRFVRNPFFPAVVYACVIGATYLLLLIN